MPSLHTVCR